MIAVALASVLLLTTSQSASRGEPILHGSVHAGEGTPIAGAFVTLLAPEVRVAVTDSAGTFAVPPPPPAPGSYTVLVNAEGFVGRQLAVEIGETPVPPLAVTLEAIAAGHAPAGAADAGGETVVVEADRMNLAPARRVLDREEVRKIPGTWGDPFRAVQNLPGAARPFLGFFGEVVVRGSAPEDTRLYVDGHEVPLLYHFGGLKSLLNPQSVETVEFLPGGFGSYYGRAIGGVLDARTRSDVPERTRVHLQTDLLDTGVFVQAPFRGGPFASGAVTAAGRRSYIDALLLPFEPDAAVPRYYDYQLKADAHLNNGDQTGLLLFGTDDALVSLSGDDGDEEELLRTIFHRLQGRWKRRLGKGRTIGGSAALGVEKGLFQGGISLKPRWTAGMRVDGRTPVVDGVATLNLGADAHGSYQRRGGIFEDGETSSSATAGEEEPDFRPDSPREWLGDAAAYAELEWTPHPSLQVVPGARVDWFGAVDETTVDPRLAARWRVDDATTLLGATGLYHQPPRIGLLGIFVFDLGALGIDIPPERAVHAVAGVERVVTGSIGVDAYVWYKHMDHLTEIVLDLSGAGDTDDDFVLTDGRGRAYGLELMLRLYPTERLFAWIGYTLSRAERRDPQGGGWFPFAYDQTHNLNAVVSWQLTPTIRMGGRVRYVTGNPFTPYVGSVYDTDSGSYWGIPGDRMSARVPAYWQIDARIDKTIQARIWRFVLFADVMNVTNRRNPEFPSYTHDYAKVRYERGLPILPMIGLEAYR